MGVETEHSDVIDGDRRALARIVLAHLKELPDYYTKLLKMEEDAPANASGTGAIAGTTEPLVVRKPFAKFIKRKRHQ